MRLFVSGATVLQGSLRDMHVRRLDTGSAASVLWTKVFSAAESARQLWLRPAQLRFTSLRCKSYPSEAKRRCCRLMRKRKR